MHGAELDQSGGGDRPGRPHYRHAGVPSVVYGVGAHHMGGVDEHATVEDLNAVFAVHALAAFDYLNPLKGNRDEPRKDMCRLGRSNAAVTAQAG